MIFSSSCPVTGGRWCRTSFPPWVRMRLNWSSCSSLKLLFFPFPSTGIDGGSGTASRLCPKPRGHSHSTTLLSFPFFNILCDNKQINIIKNKVNYSNSKLTKLFKKKTKLDHWIPQHRLTVSSLPFNYKTFEI